MIRLWKSRMAVIGAAAALTATTACDYERHDTSAPNWLLLRLGRHPTEEGRLMTELEDFLGDVLPRLHHTETSLHNGDPGPRIEMWSHKDPVTLYGAAMAGVGWDQVGAVFRHIADRFSDCESCEWEVVAAGVSTDLAYIVAIERTTCSIGGAPPSAYALRSTTVLRREDGAWKVVHRHADPHDTATAPLLQRLLPS
jgi:ketosteroid isomerase-like protein